LIDTSTNKDVITDKIGGHEQSSIAEETASIGSFDVEEVLRRQQKKGDGMTRIEAFKALQIDKPELLSTGEIQLASGKIIGCRKLRYIYTQNLRIPDEREAIVINKLSMQYRLMKRGGKQPLALSL